MVFQSYALYPHMTVFDNMAFGLEIEKKSKEEITERTRDYRKQYYQDNKEHHKELMKKYKFSALSESESVRSRVPCVVCGLAVDSNVE